MTSLQPVKASTRMAVHKPYKLRVEPTLPATTASEEKPTQEDADPVENMQTLPMAVPGPPPFMSNSVILPYPPPVQLSVYQILPGPRAPKKPTSPTAVTPDPTTPGPSPLTTVPVPGPTSANQPPPSTKPKTKPRTIHEYYDQHGFQWREFNPEDTVVGDETDPFIVYFRYASKSIGSRRTAFILPKHPQLIRVMQDCLPDYDWRTGEDMLIKAKVLYLRRKALIDAVEKLKKGETIGQVTKAFREKEEEEMKEEEEKKKEEEEKKGKAKTVQDKKDKTETEGAERQSEPADAIPERTAAEEEKPENAANKELEGTTALDSPTSTSSEATVKQSMDEAESPEAKPIQKSIDSDSTSEATSAESDRPPTPASVEPVSASTEPEPDPDELIQANVHEALELRNPVPSKMTGSLTASDETLLPITPPVEPEKTTLVTESSQPIPASLMDTSMSFVGGLSPFVPAEGFVPTMLVNGVIVEVDQPETRTEIVIPEESAKTMVDWEMLQMCVTWVKKEFSTDEDALARQLANDEISYRFLWLYFIPGTIVSLQDPVSKQQMAARVENTEYLPANPHANTPPRLELATKIIDANGDDFIYSSMAAYINEYDAAKLLSELQVRILTPDLPLYQTLKDRGKKFVELNGVHYMTLDGVLILKRGMEIIRVRSKTRVMIDCKAFRDSNPSYSHAFTGLSLSDMFHPPGGPGHHFPRYNIPVPTLMPPGTGGAIPATIAATLRNKDIKSVPEDELILCASTVFGYAFTEKAWVQMTVDGISPIEWDTEAYNKLVLPDDTKKLVKSLVQACRTDSKLVKDIISTKGSGVVFVLHGEPGTGKTLTAEAIGEELKRPILVIAVSDLGTDPTNVEIRLGSFLRTAEKWDSIVLLDEADIFLEQRGRQDIFRNAMVGVFLRLLEYHNSPMFLTTNRVFAFDPAIRSRISIAIKYHPLKRVARKQVWQQLLEMARANFSNGDLDEVSMSVLNGREVKNLIRSAQALAVADGTDLTMRHLNTVLEVQREFREDFEGLPGLWNGMGVS